MGRRYSVSQTKSFKLHCSTDHQRATHWVWIRISWAKIDDPRTVISNPLEAAIKARPTLGINFTGQRQLDVMLTAQTELDRHSVLGSRAHSFTDVITVDDEVFAVVSNAAQQDMDMGIVRVPMINRDPVQFSAKVMGDICHELTREAAYIFQLASILWRNDEAEMMPVIAASLRKTIRISVVSAGIK